MSSNAWRPRSSRRSTRWAERWRRSSPGFYQDEIHEAAYRIQRGIETEERVVVGVNRFIDTDARPVELQRDSRGRDGATGGPAR